MSRTLSPSRSGRPVAGGRCDRASVAAARGGRLAQLGQDLRGVLAAGRRRRGLGAVARRREPERSGDLLNGAEHGIVDLDHHAVVRGLRRVEHLTRLEQGNGADVGFGEPLFPFAPGPRSEDVVNLAVHDDPLFWGERHPHVQAVLARRDAIVQAECLHQATPGPDRARVDADVLVSGAQVGARDQAAGAGGQAGSRHHPRHPRPSKGTPAPRRGARSRRDGRSRRPPAGTARPGCRSGPDRRPRRTRTAGPRRSGRPGGRPARPWSRRRRARPARTPAARAAARPRRTPRSSSRPPTGTAGGSCRTRARAAPPRPAASSARRRRRNRSAGGGRHDRCRCGGRARCFACRG